VLLYPVFVALLLAAIGGGVERVAETRTYSMPGQLVDVGGHRLHISCTGSGGPTVVLEAGLGEPAVMMASRIQPAVAIGTTVCVYDRAGRGFSEPATEQQDGLTIATDLHTLLVRAHIPGPYVLAGHSSGGVYVKVFAARYPADVAGMVLIDSQPSDAIDKLPGFAGFYNGFRRASGLAPSLARLGALRLFYATAVAGLPPRPRAEERADWSTARHYRSLREEVLGLKAALTQSQELTSLGDKPLVVLTAAKDAQAGWLPLQDEMVGLSSNAVHRVARNATHTSLTEDESDASLSSQAILDVVAAVRSGTPLAQ
jgi:pimeloyl-ACP methyl ester carboxylesterase